MNTITTLAKKVTAPKNDMTLNIIAFLWSHLQTPLIPTPTTQTDNITGIK